MLHYQLLAVRARLSGMICSTFTSHMHGLIPHRHVYSGSPITVLVAARRLKIDIFMVSIFTQSKAIRKKIPLTLISLGHISHCSLSLMRVVYFGKADNPVTLEKICQGRWFSISVWSISF